MTMTFAAALPPEATKASIARALRISRTTVYQALETSPAKPPSVTVMLHLTFENFNKRGRGRKPARERIEALLKRDYAMVPLGVCDYQLTVAYDIDANGSSLDDEVNHLRARVVNIAESNRCSIETDIREVGGQHGAIGECWWHFPDFATISKLHPAFKPIASWRGKDARPPA